MRPTWISIDDKKPKPDQTVICYFGDGTVSAGYIDSGYGKHESDGEIWDVWNTCLESNLFGVTHWMPLPEPPEAV